MTRVEDVELRDVPVVDNHCHGILRSQDFDDLVSWRRTFTESADPGMAHEHVASTAFYRRLTHALAEFFGCEPEEEAVLTGRVERDAKVLTGARTGPGGASSARRAGRLRSCVRR